MPQKTTLHYKALETNSNGGIYCNGAAYPLEKKLEVQEQIFEAYIRSQNGIINQSKVAKRCHVTRALQKCWHWAIERVISVLLVAECSFIDSNSLLTPSAVPPLQGRHTLLHLWVRMWMLQEI